MLGLAIAASACLSPFSASAAASEEDSPSVIPMPVGMEGSFRAGASALEVLDAFLGIPYAADGAIREDGSWGFFAKPGKLQPAPALNCSGFVLGAARFLLGRNITLDEAKRDRLQDSGPDSPYGADWDFGWDIIMNISEGLPRAILLPGNSTVAPEDAAGLAPRGYDLHAPETWAELPARLRPGCLYFLSFSKDTKAKGYRMLHYHVGLILPTGAGEGDLWMYQTTTQAGKVYRRNLARPEERAAFLKAFANTGGVRKYMLVLEVPLPGASPTKTPK